MTWTPHEAAQIGRIEGMLSSLIGVEQRVDSLEQFRARLKGMGSIAGVIATAAIAWTFSVSACTPPTEDPKQWTKPPKASSTPSTERWLTPSPTVSPTGKRLPGATR